MSIKTRSKELLERLITRIPESLRCDISLRYGILSELEQALLHERGLCVSQMELAISRWPDNALVRSVLRGEMEDMKGGFEQPISMEESDR